MRKSLLTVTCFIALCAQAQQPVTAPYSQYFNTADGLNDFIVLDANNDDSSWDYNPVQHCAKCSWCETGPVDDYLLLPVKLEAYASYTIEYHCFGGYFDDAFEVLFGDAPIPSALTRQLTPPTSVNSSNQNVTYRATFSVEQSGTYYIAWHDISAPDQGTIFLDDIVFTGTTAAAPAAPDVVSVIPAEMGGHECDITFKMPTATLDGKPLETVSEARIYRTDNLVQTITTDIDGKPLTPGCTCTWHDKGLSNRLYTYKIVAVTPSEQESAPAVSEVYVGLDSPGRLTGLKCREDINRPGTVVLSWDVPEKGAHGGYLDPKSLSYVVSKSYNDEPTVFEPRFEEHIDVSGGQTYVAYSVYAQNYIGSNRGDWQTISTHVGPAMPAPWGESYPNVSCKNGPWLTHVTGETEIGEASWYISSPVENIPDQDGDGGYTYFFTSNVGKSARYTSPKVDISTLSSPALSFWLYEHGHADVVEVGIMPDMTDWTTLKTITLGGNEGWKRYVIDLSDYRDSQFVQIGFNGISKETTKGITAVDNISIHNEAERDIAVLKYDFPARVDVNKPAAFSISYRNRGSRALPEGSYSIELYRDDPANDGLVLVASTQGAALDTDEALTVVLNDSPGVFASDEVNYSARIVLEGDASPADNSVDAQRVRVFKPVYPVPTQLAGESLSEGVELSWQAPAIADGTALPITDSFEDYPIFSITDCGDWTLYDADGQRTTIMALSTGSSVSVLEYEHAGEPMAWQVFSSIDAGIPYSSWDPHSGELMMVSMGNSKNEADGTYHDNDDWLISPELSGRAQEISFFAKCGMGAAYQPELLEVLYSTTDRNPESFTPVLDAPIELYNVSGWEEHIVALPEGARYFALRCVSQHKFALLLDDVTYQPAGTADLVLQGYNVYRQRQLLNDQPVALPGYTDTTAAIGETYLYNVTAVYDKGESLPTPVLTLTPTDGIAPLATPQLSGSAYDLMGRPAAKNNTRGIIITNTKKITK